MFELDGVVDEGGTRLKETREELTTLMERGHGIPLVAEDDAD